MALARQEDGETKERSLPVESFKPCSSYSWIIPWEGHVEGNGLKIKCKLRSTTLHHRMKIHNFAPILSLHWSYPHNKLDFDLEDKYPTQKPRPHPYLQNMSTPGGDRQRGSGGSKALLGFLQPGVLRANGVPPSRVKSVSHLSPSGQSCVPVLYREEHRQRIGQIIFPSV